MDEIDCAKTEAVGLLRSRSALAIFGFPLNLSNAPWQMSVNQSSSGFCIDVFKEVIDSLPCAVPYKFFPFESPDRGSAGSYNDLVYQVFLEVTI